MLANDEPSIPDLAEAVERASDRSLADAVNDPGFVEALWLMLKIPIAAKTANFAEELAKLGLRVPADPTVTDVLAAYDQALERARIRSGRDITDLSVLLPRTQLYQRSKPWSGTRCLRCGHRRRRMNEPR
jgi:hypothetical protein